MNKQIVLALVIVSFGGVVVGVDYPTTIGLQNDDGQDIPLDVITGFVSKLNEPFNLWCQSDHVWNNCMWYWNIKDTSQKFCRILSNGSYDGYPGFSVSGTRCQIRIPKTIQEEHEGKWKCELGIEVLIF